MPANILIVDDEKEIADFIETFLQNEGYSVFKFHTAKDALECIENTSLDLAILDVMLPDMSGFALCRKIREQHTYPVIMLTAKDAETDKITGLTLGADDYVTKPFRPLELVARVKSQLRRYKKYNLTYTEKAEHILYCSDLVVDTKKHECTLNQKPVSLTPTEYSILQILLENKGTVISGEELFRRIWQDEYYTKSSNTITVHIRRLREKLKDHLENPKYIRTIWGVGYKIDEK